MKQITKLMIAQESLWWLLTFCVSVLVFFPVMGSMKLHHYWPPFLAFLLMLWYMRLTISIRLVPYLQVKWMKWTFLIVNLAILVFLYQEIKNFIFLFENEDIRLFWQEQNNARAPELFSTFQYFKNIVFLSIVGAILMTMALEIRLISYFLGWRRRKVTDKVVYRNKSIRDES